MNSTSYEDLIRKEALEPPAGLSIDQFETLIKAVIQVESSWNPSALSYAGAIGLMQVMPANAKAYGYDPTALYDPAINILLGCRILRDEINKFGLVDGLAAYNGGPNKRHIKETQAYAQKVLRTGGFA